MGKMRGSTDFCIATTTVDGTTLEAEGVVESSLANGVKDLSLSRLKATKLIKSDAPVLGKRDLDFKVFHDLTTSESKLKLSTVLGSGVKAIGLLSSKGSTSKLSYEVEYDTTLSEGRTLSATVSPADGTGEIEYEDSATVDATITAVEASLARPRTSSARS